MDVQTRMKRSLSPATKRIVYLVKTFVQGVKLTTIVLFCALCIIVLWFALGDVTAADIPHPPFLWAILIVAIFLLVVALRAAARTNVEFESRPRVPTVRKQLEALPSAGILVRGASAPAAADDELLRATIADRVPPASELMRPTDIAP